jgi:hypothetical protein
MNLDKLYHKLVAAARKNPPGDHVPYAFERRVMARLAAAPRFDEWAAWARSLWYGAAVCAAVAVLMSVWSFSPDGEQDLAANFSQDLEQTILSPADVENPW